MGIGIALSGGGLKGIAHIGALQALEELNIDIDYIAGTSSGALVAAFYAMGYTIKEMQELAKDSYKQLTKIKKRKILKEGTTFLIKKDLKLQGIIEGEKIENLVAKYARNKEIYKISDIKKNFALVTVDSKSTRKCILSSKKIEEQENVDYLYNIPIEKAVHASMSFPAIFTPCKYEKYCFIDGGTVDNLPVDLLKDLGAKKTIALSFKMDEFKGTENLFSVILRACDIFSLKDVNVGRKISDVDVEIDIANAKLLKIDDIDSSIKIGYESVMREKEKILGMVKTK